MNPQTKVIPPGARFGIYVVEKQAPSLEGGECARWVCRCDVCGGTHVAKGTHLRSAAPQLCPSRKRSGK